MLLSVYQINSIFKIHIFDESFLLVTIRMTMVTKLVKVVTYHKELAPINMHDTLMELCFEVK